MCYTQEVRTHIYTVQVSWASWANKYMDEKAVKKEPKKHLEQYIYITLHTWFISILWFCQAPRLRKMERDPPNKHWGIDRRREGKHAERDNHDEEIKTGLTSRQKRHIHDRPRMLT